MKLLAQLAYVSAVTARFEEHEIPQLLKSIRPANAAREITGMLLYIGDNFVQILEGTTAQLDAVYAKIQRDPRHERVTLIGRAPIQKREFADWTMDFTTVDRVEGGERLGDAAFFADASAVDRLTVDHVKKLVASFKRPSWRRKRDEGDAQARSA